MRHLLEIDDLSAVELGRILDLDRPLPAHGEPPAVAEAAVAADVAQAADGSRHLTTQLSQDRTQFRMQGRVIPASVASGPAKRAERTPGAPCNARTSRPESSASTSCPVSSA